MEYLPIFFRLKETPCLVVGGGSVAARKVALLMKAGARVTVVAPELDRALQDTMQAGEIEHIVRRFEDGDVRGAALVFAATNDANVNAAVSAAAHALSIPANVVDSPQLGSFITPAIIDRSPVIAAVSSSGASPVLSRLLRGRIESLVPARFGALAALAESCRGQVKNRFPDVTARRRFWEKIFQGPIAELVFRGRDSDARTALEHAIAADTKVDGSQGEVYLVGGGPGDPDLLTFRALRLMQQADVVVYDRLVSPGVLDLVRRDAERIYVGKQRNQHTMRQEDINELLARLAKDGKRVVRLKGGDPFIFGRGGEEIETLAAQGISFQVVPGITAANGSAAYAGIPLTHRDHAQSCIFVTGHLKDGSINLNWQALAQPRQTIVFYMGLNGLPEICRQLTAHGLAADTPAALVQQATTARQRVFSGTLANMADILEREKPRPPTLFIVGHVVCMREKLGWFHPEESGDWHLPEER